MNWNAHGRTFCELKEAMNSIQQNGSKEMLTFLQASSWIEFIAFNSAGWKLVNTSRDELCSFLLNWKLIELSIQQNRRKDLLTDDQASFLPENCWVEFNKMAEKKASRTNLLVQLKAFQWIQFNILEELKCSRTNFLLSWKEGMKSIQHNRKQEMLTDKQTCWIEFIAVCELEACSSVSISLFGFCWIEFIAFYQLEACSSVSFVPFCWIEFIAVFQLGACSSMSISFLLFPRFESISYRNSLPAAVPYLIS